MPMHYVLTILYFDKSTCSCPQRNGIICSCFHKKKISVYHYSVAGKAISDFFSLLAILYIYISIPRQNVLYITSIGFWSLLSVHIRL